MERSAIKLATSRRKQNVFDDFIASGQYLIAGNTHQPLISRSWEEVMAVLLMGAALTQRPRTCFARSFLCRNYTTCCAWNSTRTANSTRGFGTVKDRDQFQALYAYSPSTMSKTARPIPRFFF